MANYPTAQTIVESDAAYYIGMSVSWLRQSRANGNQDAPPYLKIGRAVRYRISDLDEWLSGRRQYCGRQD
jgi:predicted DNA-binding transcriptional regulator AlpA